MNEITLVPQVETEEVNPLLLSSPFSTKEALIITLQVEKRLPAPLIDIPLNKWMMPPEQHGYIQGHDNDCL